MVSTVSPNQWKLGGEGITVNCIGPVYIKTEVTDSLQKNADLPHLLSRRSKEMDSAVVFLCSPIDVGLREWAHAT